MTDLTSQTEFNSDFILITWSSLVKPEKLYVFVKPRHAFSAVVRLWLLVTAIARCSQRALDFNRGWINLQRCILIVFDQVSSLSRIYVITEYCNPFMAVESQLISTEICTI